MGEPSGARDSLALLICHESESCLNEQQDDDDDEETKIERSDEQKPHCLPVATIGDDDEDYVAELVRKENQRFDDNKPTKTTSSLDRLIAIDWILTTRTRFGFQHQTAYIAISYLDLFLEKRFIGKDESWAIRLLSVASLSLAAKMEERIVPGLSQYPQDQDFVFKPDVIRKTELMILSTLDWKMSLITPFHYLNYFLAKISPTDHNNHSVSKELLLLRSSESLLALTKEISFTDYRQFVVAAATTLLASSTSSDIRLTREEMSNKFGSSISWWTSNENDNLYSCYQRMQEIEERKHMTPPELAVPGPVVGSGSGAKRRLSFDDSDQPSSSSPPAKRMRRL
ncbi:hypothetical protein N665_2742s0004 [Sinapis alba]|nr:hypothetical protein N665_2742s0004 [Sinapis alba]